MNWLITTAGKYFCPALLILIGLLLAKVAVQHSIIKHQEATIAKQTLVLNEAKIIHEQEVKQLANAQRAADIYHAYAIEQRNELAGVNLPDDCEQARVWAIEKSRKP